MGNSKNKDGGASARSAMALGLVSSLARLKYDTRVQDWHLAQGKMTREEFKAHLQGLEDCSAKIDLEAADSDDDFDEADEARH